MVVVDYSVIPEPKVRFAGTEGIMHESGLRFEREPTREGGETYAGPIRIGAPVEIPMYRQDDGRPVIGVLFMYLSGGRALVVGLVDSRAHMPPVNLVRRLDVDDPRLQEFLRVVRDMHRLLGDRVGT